MHLQMGAALGILQKRPRRVILTVLKRHGGRIAYEDVVSRVDPPTDRAVIELEHVHLPKLEEEGYITWFRDAKEFSRGPNFDEIEPFIALFDRNPDVLPCEWP